MRVSVNVLRGNATAANLCAAMAGGINLSGDVAVMRNERDHDMSGFGAAVLYGFTEPCQAVANACKRAGIPWVFMDMGYWQRGTHYKVTVNDRHPTQYLMHTSMPGDRFKAAGLTIKDWRRDDARRTIVVAGMSAKAAWSWGRVFEEWERATIAALVKVTKRRIIYRPKPTTLGMAKPIVGASFSAENLDDLLSRAHCVFTHHSNVGCDALVAGLPVFTRYGAAWPMSLADTDLTSLEAPSMPYGREQWAANLAYCQWSAKEMADGSCWRHMRSVMELLNDIASASLHAARSPGGG